jgi:lactoylglutathione lyase
MKVSCKTRSSRPSFFKLAAMLALFSLPLFARAQAAFNHTALCSTNLKESNEFYASVLKLKVIPNPFKDTVHTWYSIAPNVTMHVIQGDCPRIAHNRGEHLCFSVPSIKEFVALLDKKKIAYCNWKGVPNQVEHRVDGVSQVYFTDPDGFWIEVNDAK